MNLSWLTLTEPIATLQEPFSSRAWGAESEHVDEEEQSPHEQPNKESPQEYTVELTGFTPDDKGAVVLKSILYGDPGEFRAACVPRKDKKSIIKHHSIRGHSQNRKRAHDNPINIIRIL